ncbi:hypothetical protein EBL_c36120 [Shimwellia blattae DSM 4481 = NBRC 105725]|uniref:Uncharacterized protein n=1 Tax=Shimwellia blattae (strain ATCC 29907 / DSM 4481 / JCM 1650 / NBRC 105725 / CDC 9005-74) TaxID=630626 RepID=I2BDR0_SHIBC|nr:hypothetical protein EBL_c36120 [Shimwellia blattae DSM 4481 = NBRC 105725]GAB81300.1 putative tyrosine recombinase [Shimwellia blattae DSM 4481 = NBRC 105725]
MLNTSQNNNMDEVVSGPKWWCRTAQEKISIIQRTMELGMTGLNLNRPEASTVFL